MIRRSSRGRGIYFIAGAIAVALLGSAACTATVDTGQPTVSTTAPPTSKPPTTQDRKADQKLAVASLLVIDDLSGSNWSETKRQVSTETTRTATDDPTASCPEVRDRYQELGSDPKSEPVSAKSPQFTKGTESSPTLQVEETVEVRATVDEATTLANVLGDKAMIGCLKTTISNALKADTSNPETSIDVDGIKIERIKTGALGDDHAVFSIVVPTTSKGIGFELHFVAAFVRVGRGYVNLTYGGLSPPSIDKDLVPLLETAAKKVRRQLDK